MMLTGDTGGRMRAPMRVSLATMFAMLALADLAGAGDLSANQPSESAQCGAMIPGSV